MQKTISSKKMNRRTSLVKPFLYTLCLLGCCGLNLYGQQQSDPALHFVDSLNQIITSQPAGSKAQTAASEELRARLIEVLKHGSPSQRGIAMRLVPEIDYKKGTYKALIPHEVDTISNKIVLLEKQLKKWQDSLAQVQQDLKKIIEDKEQNRATKEKAVFTLARIHDRKVLDYLFENEEKLRFTKRDYNSSNYDLEVQEMNRTGMVAIGNEYFYKESTEIERWLLFYYLLHDLKQNGYWEMALVNLFLTIPEHFKSEELLLEFMYDNSNPGSKTTIEFFLPTKNMQKN